jgi:hypothetical protein
MHDFPTCSAGSGSNPRNYWRHQNAADLTLTAASHSPVRLIKRNGVLNIDGGPTQTVALLLCSPAIDQGKRDTITALTTNIDQRGFVRPVDLASISNASGGDGSEIGAFEVQNDVPAIVFASISASPNVLTPANHALRLVTVSVSATDACAAVPVCKIISVTSNEPDNGIGDGDFPNDIEITGDLTVKLRAERSGKGKGRVYTITVQCMDSKGNASTATTTVLVNK